MNGAFTEQSILGQYYNAAKNWVLRCVFRRPPQRTAHAVVPQGYVVLTEMHSHTLEECQRADEHNRQLYALRLECVQTAAPGLSCDPIEEPPAPDNCARYETFCVRNTPVEADVQARAVEALAAAGFRATRDYPPHQAVDFQKSRGVLFVSCDAPSQAMTAGGGGPNYTLFADDELRTMSKRQCMQTDRANNVLYRKASKRCRRARERLGSIARVHMEDMSQSRQSNYQRKIKIKVRDTLVSAAEQAAAVEALYDQSMRLYADYEPQNAIALAAQCATDVPERRASVVVAPLRRVSVVEASVAPVLAAEEALQQLYPWNELCEESCFDNVSSPAPAAPAPPVIAPVEGSETAAPPRLPAWPPASHFTK